MNRVNELRLGFDTAYIDGNVASSMAYKPQFLSNNYKEGKKVISSIEDAVSYTLLYLKIFRIQLLMQVSMR